MNPGKRKRFLVHDGDITSDGLTYTLDKILGGDARFKRIKVKMPKFSLRKS